MICPHCKKDIPDATVARHLASKGGKAGKRTITVEQQAAMQAARVGNKQITTAQLADYLKISKASILRSIKDGHLVAELISGKYLIRTKEAVGWWGRCYTGNERDTFFQSVQMFRDLEKL